jgi:hypothetical protein
MRRVLLFVFAVTIFIVATSARGVEVSCDFSKCLNICRGEYESGCTGMCNRIISLCRQLLVKPARTSSERRVHSSPDEPAALDARARESIDHMD